MLELNHYEILEIDQNANALILRDAFNALAKKHHPDKNQGDSSAEQRMQRINLAYEVLSSPVSRKAYDHGLSQCEKKFEEVYDLGRKAYDQKEFSLAIKHFSEAIKMESNNSRCYFSRGLAFFNQKKYSQAISDFTSAIKLDPTFLDAYCRRGEAYAKGLLDNLKAINDFNRVLELDPNNLLALNSLGFAYQALSEECFAKANSIQPVQKGNSNKSKSSTDKDLKFEMVVILADTFLMGSPENEKFRGDDESLHLVSLAKYYIGKHQVTQEQWESVMGENPSKCKGDRLPITDVSWEDCQKFIKMLNSKSKAEYRLPTEAEWEYACRAGAKTAYSFGKNLTPIDANCNESKIGKPVPVGSFGPNAFGLFDMHGNVWEWCSDWYGNYPKELMTDPKGSSKGKKKVMRGGSFNGFSSVARSAFRNNLAPDLFNSDLGLRLARNG